MEKFFRRPWLIVAVIGILTVFFAFQLPRIELDNNNYRFIPKHDPARLTSDFLEETFGSQTLVLVGLERKYDTVFDPDFIGKIREYDRRLKEIGLVDTTQSIASADYITSEGDSIVAEPLVPDTFGGSPGEIAALKDRVLSWDMYEKALVSDDFRSTQVVVSIDVPMEESGGERTMETFRAIKNLANEIFDDGSTTVYVAGLPVLSANVNEAMSADLVVLIPLVVIVVLLVLFFSFRRGISIILPMLTVLIATLWSVGAMPLFGVKLSVISTCLPVILVAVGSAYGIHVVTHYVDDREIARDLSKEEHRELVFALVRKIGKPVFLAALTTFVGFVSFCFTSVLPIREFGYFSSFGVVVSFLVALTLIPALFLIRGPAPLGKRLFSRRDGMNGEDSDALSVALADSLTKVARNKRKVLALTAAVVIASLFGLSRLVVDNVFVEYFKPDTDTVRSDRFIREKFGGTKLVSVVVQSETPGGVLDPEVLGAMDGLAEYLKRNVPEAGKVTSFADIVKRINQVYNADESPDGLALSVDPAKEGDVPSGDDSAFGFSDLGDFGSFDQADGGAESASTVDAAALPIKAYEPLDAKSLARELDRATRESATLAMGANDLLSALRRAVNHEGAAYYEIPVDPAKYGKTDKEGLKAIISNYMVLLSGDIDSWSNDPLEPTAIRMNVQLRTVGQIDTGRAIREIEEYAAAKFPDTVKVTVGGQVKIEKALNDLVIWSQVSSVFISLLMVFLIIAVSYRSIVAGLIGVVPLSISILMNFAIMGFCGIKLNIATALVASVSVGIGVDYTIHYLEAYFREWRATRGEGDYLQRTFKSSGKAIIINAASVGAGFAVLLLSNFRILQQFGLLIAFTMFSSSLIALTVLPVLLNLFKPAFVSRDLP